MELLDYDTIIFDLDGTVWNGSRSHFWAKSLVGDVIKSGNKIIDKNNDYIELQDGVREVLFELYSYKKNIGFLTRGGLLDVKFEEQPPVKVLKMFNLFECFNFTKGVMYCTEDKSDIFQEKGKTIFIDDNTKDLEDIERAFPNVDCVCRYSFIDWKDICRI